MPHAKALSVAWLQFYCTHIALHEIGADFEICSLSFVRREHRDPAYLAINPEGKVPTLLIDGRPLTEVAGILFYLAGTLPLLEAFYDRMIERLAVKKTLEIEEAIGYELPS